MFSPLRAPTVETDPSDVLAVDSMIPHLSAGESRCWHQRPGYAQFPARCVRRAGHVGNHAAGGSKVTEVWDD